MGNLFGGVYRNKTVVITGNTGFKGSWLALWLQQLGAKVHGFSADDHGSDSHFNLLKLDHPTFLADICDRDKLKSFLGSLQPDIIFHLAAQSLVRESYRQPLETYRTNVLGTLHVMEASLLCGCVKAMVNVTTDKVYQNTSSLKGYSESDPLGGHDMYSSSKACSEILTESYRKSFLTSGSSYLLASARAGNVIGGGDWADDRLVPDVIRAAYKSKTAAIRNPESVRPWQHVLEPLSGYLLLGQKLLERQGAYAAAWNFGPRKEDAASVREILSLMEKKWKAIQWASENPEQEFHEASLLQLNSTHAEESLGWTPVWNLTSAVEHTLEWYKAYFENAKVLSRENLDAYIAAARQQNKPWCK